MLVLLLVVLGGPREARRARYPRRLDGPARRHLYGFVLPLGCAILAARHLPAGLIVLREALTPLIIVVLALAIPSEAVAPRRLAAVALGLSDVLLVVWPELIGLGEKPLERLLLALLITIAYGTDTIYVAARWPDGLS